MAKTCPSNLGVWRRLTTRFNISYIEVINLSTSLSCQKTAKILSSWFENFYLGEDSQCIGVAEALMVGVTLICV